VQETHVPRTHSPWPAGSYASGGSDRPPPPPPPALPPPPPPPPGLPPEPGTPAPHLCAGSSFSTICRPSSRVGPLRPPPVTPPPCRSAIPRYLFAVACVGPRRSGGRSRTPRMARANRVVFRYTIPHVFHPSGPVRGGSPGTRPFVDLRLPLDIPELLEGRQPRQSAPSPFSAWGRKRPARGGPWPRSPFSPRRSSFPAPCRDAWRHLFFAGLRRAAPSLVSLTCPVGSRGPPRATAARTLVFVLEVQRDHLSARKSLASRAVRAATSQPHFAPPRSAPARLYAATIFNRSPPNCFFASKRAVTAVPARDVSPLGSKMSSRTILPRPGVRHQLHEIPEQPPAGDTPCGPVFPDSAWTIAPAPAHRDPYRIAADSISLVVLLRNVPSAPAPPAVPNSRPASRPDVPSFPGPSTNAPRWEGLSFVDEWSRPFLHVLCRSLPPRHDSGQTMPPQREGRATTRAF